MQLGSSQYYYRERQAGIWYGLDCFPLLCTFSLIIIERRILAEEVEKKRLLQNDIFNFSQTNFRNLDSFSSKIFFERNQMPST